MDDTKPLNPNLIPNPNLSHNIEMDADPNFDPFDPFQEKPFDQQFWNDVSDEFKTVNEALRREGKPEKKWLEVVTKVRVGRIKEKYEGESAAVKRPTLVELMTTVYDKYKSKLPPSKWLEMKPIFEKMLTEFAEVLLHEDAEAHPNKRDRQYSAEVELQNGQESTILHLAAARNLDGISRIYVKLYKGSVYDVIKTQLPLQVALESRNDATAHFLVKNMVNDRVRLLFEARSGRSAACRFSDYLVDPSMKKTVLAILDSCVNPHWPYLQNRDKDEEDVPQEAWDGYPEMPLQYHFYYR